MNQKNKLSLARRSAALCLGLAVLGAPSAAAATRDLAAVVGSALSSNPDVAEARNQWRARRAEVRQAEGGFLPSVDLNAGIGYEYTDSPTTRAADNDSNELTRKELGLNVRQMLFDGHGTRNEVDRQRARTTSAAARLLAVGESTAMRTVEAYADLQRFATLRDISAESLQIHRRIEDQIRLRSEAGVGRRADFDQVTSRVALAEVNMLAADVNLRDAETTFQRVVGELPGGPYAPAASAATALPASLEQALDTARRDNPLVAVAAADIDAAKAQHQAAKQFDYPRFDLELGGNLNDDIAGTEGHVDDMSAMIRMRYNLYRGGSDSARKQATAHNINEAKDVRDRTLRQLEESLRLAWAANEATARQLPLLERQVVAARATRDAYEKQFNIGQRTLLDLLNSENEVLQARQSVVQARTDNLLAQYRILEATGALIDHLGVGEALAGE
ncbi:MAG: TolC family outer membrane protein [Gammaproteobacteria bacterium]|nr:TolC family outer membrane protein [Gammaproteobacteria bacterium]